MDIVFRGATCPIKFLHIGVRGNNLIDKLVFVVNRYTPDDIDLSEFVPYVKLQNEKENYIDKDSRLAVAVEEKQLRLAYQLRNKTTVYASFDMQLQFEKAADDDYVVWQTEVISVTLSRTIPADTEIVSKYPSVIQDLTERVGNIENTKIINGGKP